MAKKYKGSLTLEWFNKQKAIVNLDENSIKGKDDIPAPRINWINKEEALFYELNEEEGKGNTPYWVNRDDIRVKEARPLVFQKAYKAISKDKPGTLPDLDTEYAIQEITNEEETLDIDNMLIKGDNLLALNTLKKHFDKVPINEKVKCIYIDPPYNTGAAFEHYDDNFSHSEWLTMMRDRLIILKSLLKDDGCIFIQADDQEVFYLKVLMDEIFGREKFVNSISVRSSTPSGVKTAHKNKTIIKQKDTILFYKNSDSIIISPQYIRRKKWDTHFNVIVDKEKCNTKSLLEVLKENDILNQDESLKDINLLNKKHYHFIIENKNLICQSASHKNKEMKAKSTAKQGYVFILEKGTENETMYYNGRQLSPLSKSLNTVLYNNTMREDLSILLCDFWNDIDFQNTQNEGGVSFPTSKKPEKLIQRLFNLVCLDGDLVLDCFGGSGTTFAVAQKLKLKWVGLEIGNHAETHIIPRLSNVINGSDQSGISKSVNWKGGGSFKYYHLGESIINIDKETGKGEFNWVLGKQFIQESLLVSYDFVLQEDINLFPAQLFQEKAEKPSLGKIYNNGKSIYGVSFLAAPKDKDLTITNEDIKTIYSTLKKQDDFQSVVIYTNKGIDIAQDTIPVDLEIIKVPHAIFAELER